jgi:2-polyprenyl-3-methyl-5-hydroxy-6-metoxy-1,4-benzoquinol methylase
LSVSKRLSQIEIAGHSVATTIQFRGSGPGPQTLDGCSVEYWKLLPAGTEPSLIASIVPSRGSILELGAGVGRITHPLVELGYSVTAVDNSPEMLAEIRGATTVLSDIEELSLDISFDAVVLGSFLIHAPVHRTRAALLEVCRRHVKPSGVVLVQHYREGWLASAVPGLMGEKDGIKVFADEVAHDGRFVHITLRHEAARGTWTQSFVAEALSQWDLNDALANAGLSFERHIDQDRSWLLARPTSIAKR